MIDTILALVCGSAHATAQAVKQWSDEDIDGDPLPTGDLARLGSTRWRES